MARNEVVTVSSGQANRFLLPHWLTGVGGVERQLTTFLAPLKGGEMDIQYKLAVDNWKCLM